MFGIQSDSDSVKVLIEKKNVCIAVDDDAADYETNNLVVEDEPTLQIDESWCSHDEDGESETNHEVSGVNFEKNFDGKINFSFPSLNCRPQMSMTKWMFVTTRSQTSAPNHPT